MQIEHAIAYLKEIWREDREGETAIKIPDDQNMLEKEFTEDMSIFYLLDEGDSFLFVNGKMLSESTYTLDDLHQIGLKNLYDISKTMQASKNDKGIIYFTGNGNFEASLVLVDYIWDSWLIDECPNGYYVTLPARDILAICDKSNDIGIQELKRIAGKKKVFDHQLSDKIYERIGNTWRSISI